MTATAQTPTSSPSSTRPGETSYEDTLRTLSEASVHQHFDAFLDIDWERADHDIDPRDPRWVLPETDVLGGHPWYRSLPLERQVEIGLYRQASITKVGLQFEQILISGLMNFAFGLPNGSPEFRYATHEATEECHHTQMFQEFVNRSGQQVAGGSLLFRSLAPVLPLAARWVPFAFFVGVLAGEEPIDHLQKSVLRAGEDTHPLLRRIMQIHVAEEARHIGFAHTYLQHQAPKLSPGQRHVLALVTPLIMRWLCDEIMRPSRPALRHLRIPRSVAREVWWSAPHSRSFLRDLFGDVRMLVEDCGLMTPLARRVWRLRGIDGRPSRFRSEPASAAA